jgi:hypothetical protein
MNQCRRTGAVLLWALIVLSVLAVTSATAAWQIGAARRGLTLRQNRLQAEWLARSGCELAAARLLADPAGYTGESVELIPEATVRVTVEKDADKPDTYRVRCETNYPVGDRTELSRAATRRVTIRTDGGRRKVEMTTDDPAP